MGLWTALAMASVAMGPGVAAADKLLVTNGTIVTLDEQYPDPFTGYVLVGEDGRIAAVGQGSPPAGTVADETYDAAGEIVMPGFLSGHSHLWQSAFRGIAADQWVTSWVQSIHRTYGPHFAKGDLYAFTLHGALDYLRHGITTTYNYSQNVGVSQALYEEQFQAELDAGARFIFGYALSAQPSVQEARQDFESFLERATRGLRAPHLLKISIATGGGTRDAEYLDMVANLMRTRDLDVQMHFLEAPTSQETNQESFDPIERAGLLGPKLVFAHFIHTNDTIVARSASAGTGMIWNALSNGRLASGLADIPSYTRAGLRVGMGLDGQASADISDPFENMRMGLYGLRMEYEDAKVMQPIDVLKLHTIGTADVLGVAREVGTLTPGKFADFLIVDPADLDTGPVSDVYATLVFACKISNLERVYVGGSLAVERGRLVDHDSAAIAREVHDRVAAVSTRLGATSALLVRD
jgi:cytosine/adenosine deaminase-related metal-dependent hydrolase